MRTLFTALLKRVELQPIGWIQELVDGRQIFHAGDMDPRKVHDNGQPCYRVYRLLEEPCAPRS